MKQEKVLDLLDKGELVDKITRVDNTLDKANILIQVLEEQLEDLNKLADIISNGLLSAKVYKLTKIKEMLDDYINTIKDEFIKEI